MELWILQVLSIVFCMAEIRLDVMSLPLVDTKLAAIRAGKLYDMIKKRPCVDLTAEKNCANLKQQPSNSMNFYMASKIGDEGSLTLKSALNPRHIYNGLDAIVVVDPIPDAHFGHTLLVGLIRTSVTKSWCAHEKRHGVFYETGE